ncbi:MAG TPA: pilus assembly protein [Firmicutes bacterium]|nr:pilus assembly protein [Bacillota bacterium]
MKKTPIALNGHQLKLIAMTAMLIDHLAWAFVKTDTGLGQAMHAIGRITAPTMCFFIAEGYRHTRSLPRYLRRIAVFALISQIPFSIFSLGEISIIPLNVLYTLGLGLVAIYCYDNIADFKKRKWALAAVLVLAIPADWTFIAPLLCLLFHVYRDDFPKQVQWLSILGGILFFAGFVMMRFNFLAALQNHAFHLGVVLSLPLLRLYNGKRGGGRYSGWIFYIFYPLHLLIIGRYMWFY